MKEIKDKKLIKINNSDFEIYDIERMQKISLKFKEINELFLKLSEQNTNDKFDGLSMDDMKNIENIFFNQRASIIEKYITGNAWRITLNSQGEEYIQKHEKILIENIKQYREMYPDKTYQEIEVNDKKTVIIDNNYNIRIVEN